MKKFLTVFLLTSIFINAMPLSLYANEYKFESGADSKTVFGKSTSSDEIVPVNQETVNIRRNKDASYFPPSYGIFSGEIPTDKTSLYHNNINSYGTSSNVSSGSGLVSTNNINNSIYDFGLPDTVFPTVAVTSSVSPAGSTSVLNTSPWKYDDGSIGSLYIPKINKTLKVYEGESLENMRKGIGHFESTSAWDGNVALAGHNRGASGYFGFVKDLEIGDKMTYTTKYGVRNYKIVSKVRINDTDYTSLGWTDKNTITLITCVENTPSLRWSVQAEEVK